MLTELKLYNLAYKAQLDIWYEANKRMLNLPNNQIAKIKEEKEYKLLREISNKLYELEKGVQ